MSMSQIRVHNHHTPRFLALTLRCSPSPMPSTLPPISQPQKPASDTCPKASQFSFAKNPPAISITHPLSSLRLYTDHPPPIHPAMTVLPEAHNTSSKKAKPVSTCRFPSPPRTISFPSSCRPVSTAPLLPASVSSALHGRFSRRGLIRGSLPSLPGADV